MLLAATLALLLAQAPPAPASCPSWDAVSIKPAERSGAHAPIIVSGRFTEPGVWVSLLIQFAYALPEYRTPIEGEPAWFDTYTDQWAINATATARSATKACTRVMVQALLRDCFQLEVHWKDATLRGYPLTTLPGGPHLQPPTPECATDSAPLGCGMVALTYRDGTARLAGKAVTIENLVTSIGGQYLDGDLPVIDSTGVTNTFDFVLTYPFTRVGDSTDPPALVEHEDAVSLQQALSSELGLWLDYHPRSLPAKVLVIDHVEPPTPN